MFRRTLLTLGLCLPFAATAQQLAHPGWRGNSITPEVWYRHTTLVRFPSDTTFAQATAGIDLVSTVGADSLILPDLAPPNGAPQPFADTFGTDDQLDTLLREASARRMHILLQAPLSRLAAHPGEVRFWMNRGIAGFDLGTITAADAGSLQILRSALDHFPGQRILLARQAGDIASDRKTGSHITPLAFRVVSADTALPANTAATPTFVDIPAQATQQDDATGLLRSFIPLLLSPGQPIFDNRLIRTDAGRAALRQILLIRNTHLPSHGAQAIAIQSGDLRAWLLKSDGRAAQRSLVILENTGSTPGTTHLRTALTAAGARGSFLRPTLRTDGGMGALDLEGSTIPAGAFVIAELQ